MSSIDKNSQINIPFLALNDGFVTWVTYTQVPLIFTPYFLNPVRIPNQLETKYVSNNLMISWYSLKINWSNQLNYYLGLMNSLESAVQILNQPFKKENLDMVG